MKAVLFAAVLSACVGRIASAGFDVSVFATDLDAKLVRIDLYALNTGHGTGTKLSAYEMNAATGGHFLFSSDGEGGADLLNLQNTPNRSAMRVRWGWPAGNYVASQSPASNWTPAPQIDSNTVVASSFSGAILSQSQSVPADTGPGVHFASLVACKCTVLPFHISGTFVGDQGPIVPFFFDSPLTGVPPFLNVAPSSLVVDVSHGPANVWSDISWPASPGMTELTRVSDLGTLADNYSETGTNPRRIQFTHLDATDLGTHTLRYELPNGTDCPYTAAITLNVIPEPTWLGGLFALTVGRRRRCQSGASGVSRSPSRRTHARR